MDDMEEVLVFMKQSLVQFPVIPPLLIGQLSLEVVNLGAFLLGENDVLADAICRDIGLAKSSISS